jgi:NADH:ubiquinone oxidoreductase subunit F (NADH-binding)
MKNEFKVGDRVRYIGNGFNLSVGETGTVCYADEGSVGVAWDIPHFFMHDCCGHCSSGHGWFIQTYNIEAAQPEPEQDYATLNVLELFA